jgi:hypothetical protein
MPEDSSTSHAAQVTVGMTAQLKDYCEVSRFARNDDGDARDRKEAGWRLRRQPAVPDLSRKQGVIPNEVRNLPLSLQYN